MMQSQMEGGSLFSGGGFMPSQATQATAPGSQQNTASPFKKSSSSGLVPLTLKQINQATQKSPDQNANFHVHGVEVNNVTLVGMVGNRQERATDVSFSIDDGTGVLEVRRWANDPTEYAEVEYVKNGLYVRVHGHLRSFQNKKLVNAFSVRPITDFNEVTFHFLECIYIHLHNLKSQGGSIASGSASPGVKGTAMSPTSVLNHANRKSIVTEGPLSSDMGTDITSRVNRIFQLPEFKGLEQGVHVDEVARRLPGYTKKQIMDAISFLTNEGNIYSTIDDQHYQSVYD